MKRHIYEGIVNVCAHRVSFWFDLEAETLTDEIAERLTEEAENRAKECIVEGYVSGELNVCFIDELDNEQDFSGWWEIEKESI